MKYLAMLAILFAAIVLPTPTHAAGCDEGRFHNADGSITAQCYVVLVDVAPTLPQDEVRDRAFVQAVESRQLGVADTPQAVAGADFTDLVSGQFRRIDTLAPPNLLGMQVTPMSLTAHQLFGMATHRMIVSGWGTTAPSHVLRIFSGRADNEVRDLETGWVVAKVLDEQPLGDRANPKFISGPVDGNAPLSEADATIPATLQRAGPNQARQGLWRITTEAGANALSQQAIGQRAGQPQVLTSLRTVLARALPELPGVGLEGAAALEASRSGGTIVGHRVSPSLGVTPPDAHNIAGVSCV